MAYQIFHSTQPRFEGQPLRLALFDLDGTLITSKSGKRWAADGTDWVFMGGTPDILKRYAMEGWTIVIVSNQSEWSRARSEAGPRTKISTVLDALFAENAWAPWCLVATGPATETLYRKPARGLYDLLLRELDATPTEVMMCGDAVGAAATRPEYRWSDSDAVFARNIGATFQTPEAVFGRGKPRINLHAKEIVILVGNMGSGKSSSAHALCAQSASEEIVCDFDYQHLEQDVLKNARAMLRSARNYLGESKSVIVDATHATSESRAPYIALARELGVTCRILWHIRDGRPYNALRTVPVPDIAYSMYSKRFEDPRLDGVAYELIY
jgi:bifunctional polynucleotide phosphatase/kinase